MRMRKSGISLTAVLILCAVCLISCSALEGVPSNPSPSLLRVSTPSPAPSATPSASYGDTSPENKIAFEKFCRAWNTYLGSENPDLALTPEDASRWEPDATDPAGAEVLGLRVGNQDLHVTTYDGEVIKAEIYTLTGDWKDTADGKIWNACWKAMVASVNDNLDSTDFLQLLGDLEQDMPSPLNESETARSEVVSLDGWSYRTASIERGPGLEYDKRVRACQDAYAEWLDWY